VSVGHDYGDDELALFGGQTKVIFSKILSRDRRHRRVSGRAAAASSPASSSSSSHTRLSTPSSRENDLADSPHPTEVTTPDHIPDVHPSLVEYLSLLPPQQHPANPPHTTYDSSSPDSTLRNDLTFFSQHYANVNGGLQGAMLPPNPIGSQPHNCATDMSTTFYEEPSAFVGSTNGNGNGYVDYMYPSDGEPSSGGIAHYGMMASGASGMDLQWKSFLQESGFFDRQDGMGVDSSLAGMQSST
jgi:hypothetical protein